MVAKHLKCQDVGKYLNGFGTSVVFLFLMIKTFVALDSFDL